MKSLYKLAMMYALMGIMLPVEYGANSTNPPLTPEEMEEIRKIREQKALERAKKRGLKEWNIQGIKVIALNWKNAVRKAEKIRELITHDSNPNK